MDNEKLQWSDEPDAENRAPDPPERKRRETDRETFVAHGRDDCETVAIGRKHPAYNIRVDHYFWRRQPLGG